MPPVCYLENFRLIVETLVEGALASFVAPSTLTLAFGSLTTANALVTRIQDVTLPPLGVLVGTTLVEIVSVGSVTGMTLTLTTDAHPGLVWGPNAPLAPDCNLTGESRRLVLQTVYSASVDEINEIRAGGASGALETRLITLEGRWLKLAPKLVSDNRYTAALLSDSGVWISGTFKHQIRARSRFGLESYFGSPLAGSFTPILRHDIRANKDPLEDKQTLAASAATNQFNYPSWL